MNGLDIY